jgi:hypothetical protein
MGGRTYKIENGRRVLEPTELQLQRLASEASIIMKSIDGYDRNGLFSNAQRRQAIIEHLKKTYTPEQLAEMLKKGKADTWDFAMVMAVRAYLDEKDGLKISDLHNKSSKWNREKLLEEFHSKEVEYCAIFDKNDRFIGYNIGTVNSVGAWSVEGMEANGTFLHNHPTNPYTRLGGGLSIYQMMENKRYAGDILSFRREALKEITATGREGTYTLKRDKRVKISLKEIKQLQTEFHAVSSELMNKYSAIRGSFRSGTFGRAHSIEHFRIVSSWAQKKGLSYTFTPRKGFEDLLDKRALTKPLPPV